MLLHLHTTERGLRQTVNDFAIFLQFASLWLVSKSSICFKMIESILFCRHTFNFKLFTYLGRQVNVHRGGDKPSSFWSDHLDFHSMAISSEHSPQVECSLPYHYKMYSHCHTDTQQGSRLILTYLIEYRTIQKLGRTCYVMWHCRLQSTL